VERQLAAVPPPFKQPAFDPVPHVVEILNAAHPETELDKVRRGGGHTHMTLWFATSDLFWYFRRTAARLAGVHRWVSHRRGGCI
jgi:hypothetical protein